MTGPRRPTTSTNHSLKSRAAGVSIASNATLIVVQARRRHHVRLDRDHLRGAALGLRPRRGAHRLLVGAPAAEPPDERHHYGHEKVENLSGVIEALLIIAAAGVIIYEGVMKIIDGPSSTTSGSASASWWSRASTNLIVSQARALPGRAAHGVRRARGRRRPPAHRRLHVVRRGRRPAARQDHRLAVLRPDRRHRRGRAHHPAPATSWSCSRPRVLLDETLPDEELEEIRRCVREHRGDIISGYHKLRARRAGSRRHVDLHVTVDEDLTDHRGARDRRAHRRTTSATASPTPTCSCTSSRARTTGSTAS